MKKIAKVLAVTAACAAMTGTVAAFAGCGGTTDIVISGSSSVTPLMEVLAAVYEIEEGKTISINQSDSGTGVNEAISGANDIGMASRLIKQGELDQGIKAVTIAQDGIALIVSEDCPVESVTIEEITNLYTSGTAIDGSITAAITREDGSGTRDAFEELFDVKSYDSGVDEQSSTGAVITAIANDQSNSMIGYISLGSLSSAEEQGCKALSIEYAAEDGSTTIVEPTVENVQNGTYGAARYFQLAIKKDMDTNSDAYQFIEWIKGYMGQSVVLYEGYVPVYYTFNEVEFVEPTPNA